MWTTATNSCFALTNSPNTNSGDCRLGQWTATLFLFSHSFPFSFWETTNNFYCAEDFIDLSPSSSSSSHILLLLSLLSSFVVQLTDQTQSIIKQQYHHLCSSLRFPFVFWNLIQALSLSLSPLSSSSSTLLAYHQVFWIGYSFFLFQQCQPAQNLCNMCKKFWDFLLRFCLSNQWFSILTELDDSSFHDELVHKRAKIWLISTLLSFSLVVLALSITVFYFFFFFYYLPCSHLERCRSLIGDMLVAIVRCRRRRHPLQHSDGCWQKRESREIIISLMMVVGSVCDICCLCWHFMC